MLDAHIVIAAANASTRFGGEAILPLHYFRILRARGYNVELITHERNRDDLEQFFGTDLAAIHFVPDTKTHQRIWAVGQKLPEGVKAATTGPLMSMATDRDLKRVVRDRIVPGEKAIVHVPIPVSPKTPSAMYGLGVPVVFGPMNGGMNYPPGYEDYMSRAERATLVFARSQSAIANRVLPGKRQASALIAANARTVAALPRGCPATHELVENGVDLSLWEANTETGRPRETGEPFRLVFMGRLIKLKAVDISLMAIKMARDRGVDVRLDILGDGEQRSDLEALSGELQLQHAVHFHGYLPQAECSDLLAGCQALILNSLHECGGAVVLEAMAMGLPVIASDWGGPADYLDANCGRLVSPVPREDFASRLADAIVELASDPELCGRLGRVGRIMLEENFDWEKKVDRMLEIYEQVLQENS